MRSAVLIGVKVDLLEATDDGYGPPALQQKLHCSNIHDTQSIRLLPNPFPRFVIGIQRVLSEESYQ